MAARQIILGRDEAISLLGNCKQGIAEKYGITALGLFGSVARNEATDTSDIDVVVQSDTLDLFTLVHSVKNLTLVRAYYQIFEQYPGLHPDGFDDMDSGWPENLKSDCPEILRRAESPASSIKQDQRYYINKAFCKLMADSTGQQVERRTFLKDKAVQA